MSTGKRMVMLWRHVAIDEYRFVYKDIKLFIPIDKMKFYNIKPASSVGSAMSYPDDLN